jgi:hypothetical protein
VAGCCEHGNEGSSSIKYGKFTDSLLNKDAVPRIQFLKTHKKQSVGARRLVLSLVQ